MDGEWKREYKRELKDGELKAGRHIITLIVITIIAVTQKQQETDINQSVIIANLDRLCVPTLIFYANIKLIIRVREKQVKF